MGSCTKGLSSVISDPVTQKADKQLLLGGPDMAKGIPSEQDAFLPMDPQLTPCINKAWYLKYEPKISPGICIQAVSKSSVGSADAEGTN